MRARVIGNGSPASKPRKSPRPALLMGMYVSYGLLQVLDAESTIRALQTKRAYEGNPVLSPFASNPAALAAFKLGLTGGTILGIDPLRKSHRRLAMVTLAVINGGYACVVLRNYREFSSRGLMLCTCLGVKTQAVYDLRLALFCRMCICRESEWQCLSLRYRLGH